MNYEGGLNESDPLPSSKDHEPRFLPPLWRQRRATVLKKLRDYEIDSVLDLGCGEGSLLSILLSDKTFTHVVGVDINKESLQKALQECSPSDSDYHFLRERPVKLELYEGSIAQADSRFYGFDAVVSVEVIEHLDPPVLEAYPRIVFGLYYPRLVILTTPNAEFNVNFPSLKYGTSEAILRNDDHRFEWTRNEFQSWCNEIAASYGYIVEYEGIGLLTPYETSVGYCTQMATFKRINNNPYTIPNNNIATTVYMPVLSIDFPYFEEDGFTNSDILGEMIERTRYLLYIDRLATLGANNYPSSPFQSIHIDKYWNVLRIRQICKSRKRLVEVMNSEEALDYFQYDCESEIVIILFDPAMYDNSLDDYMGFETQESMEVECGNDLVETQPTLIFHEKESIPWNADSNDYIFNSGWTKAMASNDLFPNNINGWN